jgi:Ca2+/H+ antiporter, TMEM165/GDT1 family
MAKASRAPSGSSCRAPPSSELAATGFDGLQQTWRWHMIMDLSTAAPAIGAAFLVAFLKAAEAFASILAVAIFRNRSPAVLGAGAGVGFLTVAVVMLGPMLERIPNHTLKLAIGVPLLVFGLHCLHKAILRRAGLLHFHTVD